MPEHQTDILLSPFAPTPRSSHSTSPLIVAVEATRLAREIRGIGRYVRALLPRLVAEREGLRLVLYVKKGDVEPLAASFAEGEFPRGRLDVRPVREMTRSNADVFWYPWNHAHPIPARGAVVPTMHDVVPLAHPDPRLLSWRKNMRWRRRYGVTATRATLIVTDSQFSADEVHRTLGVPYSRLRVVLLAADDVAPPSKAGDRAALERLGVAQPFVLAVGAADRRKNLGVLERAMPSVLRTFPGATLVLAGPRRDTNATSIDAPWSRTLGFVSDHELAALYRHASVLVQPSTYEGFGLPVLEAMQLGTPVIAARASSLPEVGGDAAIWINPSDDDALARNIIDVMSDEILRARLRAASVRQAQRFSWDETARQTIAVFEEAIAMTSRSRR